MTWPLSVSRVRRCALRHCSRRSTPKTTPQPARNRRIAARRTPRFRRERSVGLASRFAPAEERPPSRQNGRISPTDGRLRRRLRPLRQGAGLAPQADGRQEGAGRQGARAHAAAAGEAREADAAERRAAAAAQQAVEDALRERDLERNRGVSFARRLRPYVSRAAEAKGIVRRADKVCLPRGRRTSSTRRARGAGVALLLARAHGRRRTTHASILDSSRRRRRLPSARRPSCSTASASTRRRSSTVASS